MTYINVEELPALAVLRAEIEQMRSDIVALQGMRQDAEAEIERLRDLLFKLLLCQGATIEHGTLILVSPELLRRAREALGEKHE